MANLPLLLLQEAFLITLPLFSHPSLYVPHTLVTVTLNSWTGLGAPLFGRNESTCGVLGCLCPFPPCGQPCPSQDSREASPLSQAGLHEANQASCPPVGWFAGQCSRGYSMFPTTNTPL